MAEREAAQVCPACGAAAATTMSRFCLTCGGTLPARPTIDGLAGRESAARPAADLNDDPRLLASESTSSDYDFRDHLRRLAREHLDRTVTKRLRDAMAVCAERELWEDEVFVIISDAFVADIFGLLVVTDERVLFVPESGAESTVSIGFEEVARVVATEEESDLSDVIIETAGATVRLEAVGPGDWAQDLVAAIEEGVEESASWRDADEESGSLVEQVFSEDPDANFACSYCGAAYSIRPATGSCTDCGEPLVDRSGHEVWSGRAPSRLDDTAGPPPVSPAPATSPQPTTTAFGSSDRPDFVSALERLVRLQQQGALTQSEFDLAKQRLLRDG